MGQLPDEFGNGSAEDTGMSTGKRKRKAQARAHSFHLRVWPQAGGEPGAGSIWRGFIADLSGANTRYFDNGERLARILELAAGARFPGLGQPPEGEE
jgi:hypothetical protein